MRRSFSYPRLPIRPTVGLLLVVGLVGLTGSLLASGQVLSRAKPQPTPSQKTLNSMVVANANAPSAQPTPQPPQRRIFDPVRGVVRDAQGKPVPGITLYLPYWEGDWPNAQDSIVTTNADGTFTWQKPPFPYASSQTRFDVRVMPNDQIAWEMTPVVVQPESSVSMRIRELLRSQIHDAKMHWEGEGKDVRAVIEAPPMGEVATIVRGPDGQPLRRTTVQVWLAARWPQMEESQSIRYSGKTDGDGRVILRFFPGSGDLIITASGVGYGNTGSFEVLPNQRVTVDLPRLVPFGSIVGKVAPEIAKQGQVVRLGSFQEVDGDPIWARRSSTLDPQGRFVLRDVIPGRHVVYLFDSEKDAASWQGYTLVRSRQTVTVAPAARQEELVLYPLPPRTISQPPVPESGKDQKATLTGVVQDTTGNPVADATVWAVCTYNGVIRANSATFRAQTGQDGTYLIEGIPHPSGLGSNGTAVVLFAQKADSPLGLAYTTARDTKAVVPDIVLPDRRQTGTLTVQALATDGTPLANVQIEAAPMAARLIPNRNYGGNMSAEESSALQRIVAPRVVTDASGIARFTNLLPDSYTLTAVHTDPSSNPQANRNSPDFLQMQRGGIVGLTTANAAGVPVAPGTESRFTLRLQKRVGKLQVRLLLPDGTPVTEQNMGLALAPASRDIDQNSGNAGTSGSEKSNGIYDFSFAATPGLWRLSVRLRPDPPYTQAQREPMLFGQTVIAFSPYQEHDGVVDITTTRVEAGRVLFRVEDENGKSVARAAVHQSDYGAFVRHDRTRSAAATDEAGQLLLKNLPSGELRVRAEAAGDNPLPEINQQDPGPLPSDTVLTNRRRWPAVTIPVRPGATTEQTLRAVRVGYLRGTIHGKPDGWLSIPYEMQQRMGTSWRYRKETGEYLIGPLLAGPFDASFLGPSGHVQKTVQIAAGAVTRLDLSLEPGGFNPQIQEENRLRLESMTGSVFLPDGRTPAVGARVLLFDPTIPFGIPGSFWADGVGNFHYVPESMPYQFAYNNDRPDTKPTGGPRTPVMVALLPGSHGAVIIPQPASGQKPRLVLPPPQSILGKVTVAGRPIGITRPDNIRVLAACMDQGGLNNFLSVETTAQSDGSFTLAGLTPGKYVVQAALGDTYLSPARTITITNPGAAMPLQLDIPEPGKVQTVELGKASAGARAYLVDSLPPGPLSDRYRPAYYVADGAGRLRLEGLPAGPHRLRLAPSGRMVNVTVAP